MFKPAPSRGGKLVVGELEVKPVAGGKLLWEPKELVDELGPLKLLGLVVVLGRGGGAMELGGGLEGKPGPVDKLGLVVKEPLGDEVEKLLEPPVGVRVLGDRELPGPPVDMVCVGVLMPPVLPEFGPRG